MLLKKVNSQIYDYKKVNLEWMCLSTFADCSQIVELNIKMYNLHFVNFFLEYLIENEPILNFAKLPSETLKNYIKLCCVF